jgi:ubiquinone/menaquinone biosynthesis C-methylase UbiE
MAGPELALHALGWFLLAAVLSILPYTFHRLASPRLPGFLFVLPLPLAATVIQWLVMPCLPASVFSAFSLNSIPWTSAPLMQVAAVLGIAVVTFLIHWFAATILWMWNHEFLFAKIRFGAGLFVSIFALALGYGFLRQLSGAVVPNAVPVGAIFSWSCLGAAVILGVWALFHPIQQRSWAARTETVALLRSPFTGEHLRVAVEGGKEILVSTSQERFPVRDGIPTFLKPQDLTGDNGKYNQLYETIGGFYDDTQRFFAAFRGLDIDSYFEDYMSLLDVKPGDSVLETSVGTGLNFKYLPRGVKLSGLDLSAEMLTNCQNNLRRWGMEADLYLGNAESLPFADSSFDVVFTCGGFNFFSDRAKAIREMIRITKPGGHLMIEDETEEYVKSTYQNIPFTSSFFKDRKDAVTVPIDLVPPEMEEIRVEMLKEGKFYAITFRKPDAVVQAPSA